jgi:predicted NAD-dependent protein-ADP-ribosyltransferase YbiA (DUF1768 family)
MGIDDPDITDKSKWKGLNMLGEILTQVKNDLRQLEIENKNGNK